ncbi:MAG: ABC-type transport auxiliary lipoprotein family protein [Deltaproteobacteria bacterium]
MIRRLLFLAALLSLPSCLGASQLPRSYYVIANEPLGFRHHAPVMNGILYVRSLDVDAVYEKFQFVVRKSPYQLRYSDQNVWAVKPHQMISDVLAAALDHTNTFEGVTRELIEARPAYTLSGQLNAVEIYDSDDVWFAHLAVSLHVSRFSDGARVWSYDFDQRKRLGTTSFEHGARALSELSHQITKDVVEQLAKLGGTSGAQETPESPFDQALPGGPADDPKPNEPIFVPEGEDDEDDEEEKKDAPEADADEP